MRLIDADVMIDILRKSHESHATNSREESLLDRDIRLIKEQAKYHPVIIEERPHGEWTNINGDGSLWKCSNCGELSCCKGNFCPDCGASMQANDRQVTSKLKQPCPCETCQTAIDRCGCQMNLCSDYQKWKEGETE